MRLGEGCEVSEKGAGTKYLFPFFIFNGYTSLKSTSGIHKMSERVIPPWEQGASFTPETPRSNSERMKEVAKLGGQAKERNRQARMKGFKVKSASQLKQESVKQPGKMGRKPDPNSGTSIRLARMTEEHLSDEKKAFAQAFCREYIVDFNAGNAFLRAGGSPNTPAKAYEMMRWPFVLQELERMKDILEEELCVTRKDVLFGLKREANDFSENASHSARVSAWGKLGRVLKMDVQVTESNSTVTHRGGVMVVPASPTVDQWEAVTADVQQRLKEDVTK